MAQKNSKCIPITLSNTQPQSDEMIGFYVGTGGHLVVQDDAGHQITFKNMIGGTYYPFRFKYFRSTSTTAADLVGVYG